ILQPNCQRLLLRELCVPVWSDIVSPEAVVMWILTREKTCSRWATLGRHYKGIAECNTSLNDGTKRRSDSRTVHPDQAFCILFISHDDHKIWSGRSLRRKENRHEQC